MKIDLKNYVLTNLKERGLFTIFQIILTILLPLVTTPETFGLLSIIINNVSFALIFTSGGISSALTYQSSKKSNTLYQTFRFLSISTITQVLLIVIIEFLFHLVNKKFILWPTEDYLFGISGMILFLGFSITEKIAATYNGLFKNKIYLQLSSLILSAQIILLGINHYYSFYRNVNAAIMIVIGCTSIQGLVLYFHLYITNKKLILNSTQHKIEWGAYFSFAIPAYIANIIQFLATKSDLWIIDHFYGKKEVGYYAFANKLGQIQLILPIMIASMIFPILSSNKITNNNFERIIKVANLFLLIINTLGIIAGLIFIPLIWGDEYSESINPFLLTLPGYFAQSQIAIYAAYFASKANIKTNIITSIITLTILVLFDYLLIPTYGINGAAIALSVANIVSAIWMIKKYNSVNNSNNLRILPVMEDFNFIKRLLIT